MRSVSVCSVWSCLNRRSKVIMEQEQPLSEQSGEEISNLNGQKSSSSTCPTASASGTKKSNSIYHEKQMKELCALHALNNLFQDRQAFTKKDLDDICVSLSPDHFINPHRSMLGLGNYDVNVIMAALQKKNCGTIWFDKRKKISILVIENIKGFILNIPTDYKWGLLRLPFKRKHWIAINKIDDLYYNLDSKLDAPELIGHEEQLLSYLSEQLESREKELLLVVTSDVEQTAAWRKHDSDESDE